MAPKAGRSMAPFASGKAAAQEGSPAEWLRAHEEEVNRADELIRAQLADGKHFGDHTVAPLCEEVFEIMTKGLIASSPDSSETSSVLLLGEAGSGKTHVVEWCLSRLRKVQKSLVVLRAHGGAYSTDVECIRHIAAQVADQLATVPQANASFEQGMEWIRSVLKESFQHASAVVIVLDKFEHFCSRSRQTLLYNLFDIAQEVGIRLCIVGMSERMDVIYMLEKRIKSRFSMRHLHTTKPTTQEALVKVLMTKLRPPADCGLDKAFLARLNERLEAALMAKQRQWRQHVEVGRPPSWFLHQILPVTALLRASCAEAVLCPVGMTLDSPETPPPPKRRRTGEAASVTLDEVRELQLRGLSEAEHIVLLALFRMRDRQVATKTLSLVLHEVQLLHESDGFTTQSRNLDRYESTFDQLVQARLIVQCSHGAGDVSKRYLPCMSVLDREYACLVQDLEKVSSDSGWNPLKALPQQVQRWAVRHRR